jgi:hypothetical protein
MAVIKQTPQQRANTLEALNVMWPSVPEKNVYPSLADWRRGESNARPTCGTVACFGGWCAWWPGFRAQGIRPAYGGAPTSDAGGFSTDASEHLFGDEWLFCCRGHWLIPFHESEQISDHEIVTRRLRWLLKNSEVVE